jgi:putative ABC transport system permease protein
MIKHILKQIWTQRLANSWLWIELLLVSVVLWFIVDYFYATAGVYFKPLGYNIDHTYQVFLDELSDSDTTAHKVNNSGKTTGEDLLTAIKRIRAYQGVEAVSFSHVSLPYPNGNSCDMYTYDTVCIPMNIRKVSSDFFRVLHVTSPEGQTDPLTAAIQQENTVVITQDANLKFRPDGKSMIGLNLKKPNDKDSTPIKVGAVSNSFKMYEFRGGFPGVFYNYSEAEVAQQNNPGFVSRMEICIRVKPEADKDFVTHFKKDMAEQLKIGKIFLLDVKSFEDIRKDFYNYVGSFNEVKTHLAVALFLLINIFLGIIGTFWFRTSYRKSEMGLRLAIGSTRKSLRSLLISEGLILLALAIIPSMVICFNIGHAELVDVKQMAFTPTRFIVSTIVSTLLMAGIIVLGIWYPSQQTMKIQPAEVLHEQ